DPQFQRPTRRTVYLTAEGSAMTVALSGAEAACAAVQIHDGLDRVSAFRHLRHRHRISEGIAVKDEWLVGLPVLDVFGEERIGLKPVGAGAEFLDVLLEQHDVDAAGERPRQNAPIEGETELQRPLLRGGGGGNQQGQYTEEAEITAHKSEV